MTHVLVGADFSAPSRAALDYGAALARGLGGRVTAMHVVPYYPEPGEWPGVVVRPSADPERWQALLTETRAFAERCSQPLPSVVLREGDPAEELCEAIVAPGGRIANIGVHGRPAVLHLERLWLHNIAITTRLVDTAATPMLLKLVQAGRLDPRKLITHRFGLSHVLKAYDTFANAARERALKVILHSA